MQTVLLIFTLLYSAIEKFRGRQTVGEHTKPRIKARLKMKQMDFLFSWMDKTSYHQLLAGLLRKISTIDEQTYNPDVTHNKSSLRFFTIIEVYEHVIITLRDYRD